MLRTNWPHVVYIARKATYNLRYLPHFLTIENTNVRGVVLELEEGCVKHGAEVKRCSVEGVPTIPRNQDTANAMLVSTPLPNTERTVISCK